MAHRFYLGFVWTAWFASMGWLFAAKIWPTLHGGQPPDYTVLPAETESAPTVWRISWNDRRIGMAASQRLPQGSQTLMRHVVHFEKLPVDMILSETFGPLASFWRPGGNASGGSWEMEMLFATELHFNARGEFAGFVTRGDVGDMTGLLDLRGHINERHKLELTTRIGPAAGPAARRMRHELDLPPSTVVNDAFAPRAELRRLRVGQRWTIPVYRPFPPNSPPQIVAAHAERHEVILWDGKDVETVLVVYRADAGSGLQANSEPIAREWIRDDGLVLQHEVRWSNTTIRFERINDPKYEPILDYLDEETHARLWESNLTP